MRLLFILLVAMVAAVSAWAGPQDPPVGPPPLTPNFPGATVMPRPAAHQFAELIPALIEALKDTDPEVRQNSAIALSSIGREAIPALKESLRDANKDKRAASAYALGQMGYAGREAMPELLKVLKDDEASVRRSASQAISRIVTAESNLYSFGMQPPMGGLSIPLQPIPQLPPPLSVPSSGPTTPDKK